MKKCLFKFKANFLLVLLCSIIFVLFIVLLFQFPEQIAYGYEDAELNNNIDNSNDETTNLSIEPLSTTITYGPNLKENSNYYKLKNYKYIDNYNYFKLNPKHADARIYDSSNIGSCTTVAMQMLMGYHNYFSDRRLLPKTTADGKRFLSDQYGDINMHPYQDRNEGNNYGCQYIGTEDDVYLELMNITNLQTIPAVKNAANKFVEKYSPIIKNNVSITAPIYTAKAARDEIDAGRPIILGFDGAKKGEWSYHVVVAYGYGDYDGEEGFIVHYGYDKSMDFMWVPASWIGFCIKMSVNHEHRLRADKSLLSEEPEEYRCSECGYHLPTFGIFNFNNTYYGIAVGNLRHANVDEVYVPTTIHNKTARFCGVFTNNPFINKVKLIICDRIAITEMFKNCTNLETVEFAEGSEFDEISDEAFYNCYKLKSINLPDTVEEICKSAFYGCSSLTEINIPDGVVAIREDAFKGCSALTSVEFSVNNSIKSIYAGAFENCSNLQNFSTLTVTISIGEFSFANCSALTEIRVLNQFFVPSKLAFDNCPNVVIYTTYKSASIFLKDLNVPIVADCTFSDDLSYVVSFVKSDSNPVVYDNNYANIKPKKQGEVFFGWNTLQDGTGDYFANVSEAPNGVLFALYDNISGCVAQGTMITLSDGSQKAVEDLTGDEMLLVWNMFTGEFDIAPILFIDKEQKGVCEIIELLFSDGTKVKVISEHAFWDVDLNKYVFLRRDASKYIGHRFNKQSIDQNGVMTWINVELIGVNLYAEVNVAYSPVTFGHLCYYVNGMLSMPGATEGLINIFEVNPESMQIDEDAFEYDIQNFGLFTYEEFNEIVPITEEMFNAFNGQYLKISIGKGLINLYQIEQLITIYNKFFV